MTRKDFELIANVLRIGRTRTDGTPVELSLLAAIAEDFAAELPRTNPNFDRVRFLKACGAAN